MLNTTDCAGNDVFLIWILWLLAAFILGLIAGYLLKKCREPDKVAEPAPAPARTPEDLTRIEGVGEKIQKLLYADGIKTYEDLAAANHDRLWKILHDAGPAYTMHRPFTWAAQARLAADAEWAELDKWQELLKGGV